MQSSLNKTANSHFKKTLKQEFKEDKKKMSVDSLEQWEPIQKQDKLQHIKIVTQVLAPDEYDNTLRFQSL